MKKMSEAGGRPILVAADVSDVQAVEQMFDRVRSEYGRLDILINNAGIQIAEDSHELSAADFDKVLAVNLRGAFLCARAAVRNFLAREQPGVIINVSSVHQVIPKPRFLGYSVSKGGMQNLTRSLALEYAALGIRVNSIGPGATVTPINRSWIDDPVKRHMVESHIPMRRAGGSEEMAAAVAFGGGRCVPVLGRGRVHHRPDAIRGRWPHLVSLVRDHLVVRITPVSGASYAGRYRRNRNPSCSHSEASRHCWPPGRPGPARIRFASPRPAAVTGSGAPRRAGWAPPAARSGWGRPRRAPVRTPALAARRARARGPHPAHRH